MPSILSFSMLRCFVRRRNQPAHAVPLATATMPRGCDDRRRPCQSPAQGAGKRRQIASHSVAREAMLCQRGKARSPARSGRRMWRQVQP